MVELVERRAGTGFGADEMNPYHSSWKALQRSCLRLEALGLRLVNDTPTWGPPKPSRKLSGPSSGPSSCGQYRTSLGGQYRTSFTGLSQPSPPGVLRPWSLGELPRLFRLWRARLRPPPFAVSPDTQSYPLPDP
jgi:hypothetical protein